HPLRDPHSFPTRRSSDLRNRVSVASVDATTGSLLLAGRRVFPIVLSNGPPRDGNAPSGRNGLAEVRAAGVTFVRTGRADWNAPRSEEHTSELQSRENLVC